MNFQVFVADERHFPYAQDICDEISSSAEDRGTGIAQRTPEYLKEKMAAGKAVLALTEDGRFAGFSYIETWENKQYVANSGLIVARAWRGMGLAKRIKERVFQLSREKYPAAKIFSLTTGAAVMKMNYELGFRPVTFQELTHDPEFWKGCEGCAHFPVFESRNYRLCICTGLLYDPTEHIKVHGVEINKSI